MTMRVWQHGQIVDFAVPGPGGTARVCVGDRNGPHASVWRIWANRSKSDIYIAARDIASVQKWSLHETGDWRHQWETRQYAMHVTNSEDRVIDRWVPPDEHKDIGWILGFFIAVRTEDLVDYGDHDELPDSIIWLPPPPDDRLLMIHVVIARADRLDSQVQGVQPFHAFSLANGMVVILTFCLPPRREEEDAEIRSMFEQVLRQPQAAEKLRRKTAPRATVTTADPKSGGRGVWDLAVPTQHSARYRES
jgi:hypothetical protein